MEQHNVSLNIIIILYFKYFLQSIIFKRSYIFFPVLFTTVWTLNSSNVRNIPYHTRYEDWTWNLIILASNACKLTKLLKLILAVLSGLSPLMKVLIGLWLILAVLSYHCHLLKCEQEKCSNQNKSAEDRKLLLTINMSLNSRAGNIDIISINDLRKLKRP